MKTRTTFILFLTAILTLAAGSAFGSYSGGSGTAGDPYKIATKPDLLALAATTGDYSKCFILTADINMGGLIFTTAIIAADTNSSSGFQGTAFSGTFDGNDHKITNFTINGVNSCYLSLFGYITSSGLIKNLGLENCAVSGDSNSQYVSGLVGFSVYGSISNCHSTGSVSGHSNVGGLVGYNDDGSVSNCYSTGAVSGSSGSTYVGGLVGYNTGGISDCYSTGAVSASGSYYVGGLVGYNFGSGSISNCYSTSTVSGSYYVGGLVGFYFDGSISNCYSTGAVSGSSNVGGLVGYNFGSGGTVSSFWDINTSGQTASAGGTGKTTAQMKTLSTFISAGWDFTSVWVLPLGQYPMLFLRQAGDLNYDGRVDFVDFALFADHWLSSE
ncbi:MAG: GLUG motif-containing protein [Sedimentisphaerales bacterium]|jgi:hypothetical protein